jgi:hypothetical protein
LVVTVAAVVVAAVGFAVTDGGLRTDAERTRRRVLLDTTNGLAAAVNELTGFIPGEKAWVESVSGSLIELEQSHHVQAHHDFLEAASTLIAQADAAARKDLERRREELSKYVRAEIDIHLRHAVRPTSPVA